MKLSSFAQIVLVCALPLIGCSNDSNSKTTTGKTDNPTSPLSVSLSSSSITIYPDNTSTQTVQVTVSADQTLTTPATVALSGLVSGLTVSPSRLTLTSGASGTFTFQATATAGSAAIAAAGGVNIANTPSVTLPITVQATSNAHSGASTLNLTISGSNSSYTPTTTDLPVLQITTDNSAPINSTDTYVSGLLSITPGSANTTDTAYSGSITIKGHGNSTWLMPKKPYKIKLDSKSKLLGMPSQKNWILLANYDDKSLLRNAAAFQAGSFTHLAWTPHSRFVELFINGEYEGNYQLTEQIEIDKNRLNITEMDDTDTAGDAVTGGYLLEFDTASQPDDILFPISNVVFDLHDPDPAEAEQLTYIQGYLQQASDALYSDNFTDPDTGYTQYIDTGSFIDWYLVEELFKNNDSVDWSSCYIYKDVNAKLFMGPLWDFDIAAGNVNFNGNDDPTGWWLRSNSLPYPQWTKRLFDDPAFAAAVAARWKVLKPKFDTLPAWITQQSQALDQSQQNNFERWPILGEKVWPNAEAAGSYQGEIDYLNNWLTTRIAWLDAQFNAEAAGSAKTR